MNIQTLKEAICELHAKNQQRYLKDLLDEIDVKPTIDGNGRLHAPVDNYLWHGISYLGGMYLPDPYAEKYEMNEFRKGNLTYKIKVVESLVEELRTFLRGSTGKYWVENFVPVCYFYADVTKSEYTLLSKLFPQASGKKIVLVSEHGNPDNQKTWKFSSKVAWNKAVKHNLPLDMFAPGVDIKFDKDVKPYSDYDKKEVRYLYFKPELLKD